MERSRSFHMYSWNQCRPSGPPTAATSSIGVVPMVESANGMPAAAAAPAPAVSPSVCIIRVNPVGAMPNGSSERRPRTSQPVSSFETSRRIAGWNSTSWKACRARARDSSASAAPSV